MIKLAAPLKGLNVTSRSIFFAVASIVAVSLAIWALPVYPGQGWVFILFSILLNGLFISGFRKKSIFFDAYIGTLFWLGFWFKLVVRLIFLDGKFVEATGHFSGSAFDYDHALLATSCGVAALLVATFIRERFFVYGSSGGPQQQVLNFYKRYRRTIVGLFAASFVVVAFLNLLLGVYQRGSVPSFKYTLVNELFAWLVTFGFASMSAVILRYEFLLNQNPYGCSLVCLLESFCSNTSMLSRAMIINCSALMYGAERHIRKFRLATTLVFRAAIVSAFCLLFVISFYTTNTLRAIYFSNISPGIYQLSHPRMVLDRWVGIEGIMAVSSYPNLGWDLWKTAWREKYSNSGTSFYDIHMIKSPYVGQDLSHHHYISLPGILAFFFYPGSFYFLALCMFGAGIFGAAIEIFAFKFSDSNYILSSLFAEVIAYRYSNFGYVPGRSYLLLCAIFANVMLIYCLIKMLQKRSRLCELGQRPSEI